MQITSAQTQDETSIKTLLHACDLPTDDLDASHMDHFLVIKDNGKVVGSVGLEICGKYGLLRSLAVSKSLRGRSLGSKLVEQIEAYARTHQLKSLYLLTTTADQFFIHTGYQIIQRQNAPAPIQKTTEFQSICPESAVCMVKEVVQK